MVPKPPCNLDTPQGSSQRSPKSALMVELCPLAEGLGTIGAVKVDHSITSGMQKRIVDNDQIIDG
eukprot:2041838-Heterocapsa_arctica.AAC.1